MDNNINNELFMNVEPVLEPIDPQNPMSIDWLTYPIVSSSLVRHSRLEDVPNLPWDLVHSLRSTAYMHLEVYEPLGDPEVVRMIESRIRILEATMAKLEAEDAEWLETFNALRTKLEALDDYEGPLEHDCDHQVHDPLCGFCRARAAMNNTNVNNDDSKEIN